MSIAVPRTADEPDTHCQPDPSSNARSDVRSKKVEFEPYTTNCDVLEVLTPGTETEDTSRPLQRSRDRHLKSRPILKSRTSLESNLASVAEYNVVSSEAELASLLTDLDATDAQVAVGSYNTLMRLLQTHKQSPEAETLSTGLRGVESQLKRHIAHLDPGCEEEISSTQRAGLANVMQCAWKLLIYIVHNIVYRRALTDNFQQWAFERAVRVIKDRDSSRNTLVHAMHLLASQDSRQIINTHSARPLHILQALQGLDHQRTMSNGITKERVLVYKRLVAQVPSVMEQRVGLWIGPLFLAMSHPSADVRHDALAAAKAVLFTIGNTKAIAQACRQYLDTENDGQGIIRLLKQRLQALLSSEREDVLKTHVPKVWSLIIVLAGGPSVKLDHWPLFREWIGTLESCFNSGDEELKIECLRAWSYLYTIAKPYEASEKVAEMYPKLILAELEKAGRKSSSKSSRIASVSSYCMLLYYAFRPARSTSQYNNMWNAYIVKFMRRSYVAGSTTNSDLCCRILSALFRPSSAVQSWNEKRAYETQPMMPNELPTIDSKWLRDNMGQVIAIVRMLVQYSSFGPRNAISDKALICETWRRLLQAFLESRRKEVIESIESKAALQSIVALLVEKPEEGSDTSAHHIAYSRRAILARIAIEELGVTSIAQIFETTHQTKTGPLFVELLSKLLRSEETTNSQHEDKSARLEHYLEHLNATMLAFSIGIQSNPFETLRVVGRCLNAIPAPKIPNLIARFEAGLKSVFANAAWPLISQEDGASHGKMSIFASSILRVVKALTNTTLIELDELLALVCTSIPLMGCENTASLCQILQDVAPNKRGPKLFQALAEKDCSKELQERLPSLQPTCSTTVPGRTVVSKRPRHDDSQIQFVSIHSSSPIREPIESQLLTTRQKEVRSRQVTERTITFADLRSSPTTKGTDSISHTTHNVSSPNEKRPTTPTLSEMQLPNEDEAPPTPTPKARKYALDQILLPEVPSSPPSVVESETRHAIAPRVVTSEIDIETAALFRDAEERTDPLVRPIYEISVAESTAVAAAEEDVAAATQEGIIVEDRCEVATHRVSSPEVHSDEYDALAASQLSQNLVEDSRSLSEVVAHDGRALVVTPKRKRNGDQAEHESLSKRSKVAQYTGLQVTEQPLCSSPSHDDEMEDCIVVNVTSSQLSQTSKAKKRRSKKTSSKIRHRTPSSQSPSFSESPPSTNSSHRSRSLRRGRSGRTTRSLTPAEQASHQTSEVVISEHVDVEKSLDTMVDVPGSAEGKAAGTNQTTSSIPSGILGADSGDRDNSFTPQPPPVSKGESAFDVIGGLQSILQQMTQQEMNNVDLAAVHSLCFQIGLKAQQNAKV